MIIMTFGYVFHSSIGEVLHFYWDKKMVGGAPVYSSFAFTAALSVIPIGLIIGAIGFYLLSRSGNRSYATRRIATMPTAPIGLIRMFDSNRP